MFGDEARMKAELFGLDVGIDDPLEPTGALGGIHAARHGRAAEQSKSHGKISWSGSAGGGSRHRRIDFRRPSILAVRPATRARADQPKQQKRRWTSNTPFAGMTQTGSTGLISARSMQAPRSCVDLRQKRSNCQSRSRHGLNIDRCDRPTGSIEVTYRNPAKANVANISRLRLWVITRRARVPNGTSALPPRADISYHAVLIAPGLWPTSPKNGNISSVGRRLSSISLRVAQIWSIETDNKFTKDAIGGHFSHFVPTISS